MSVGLSVVYSHEATPAPQVRVAAEWPVESSIPRPSGTHSIIMFAHPHCPCTRASIQELSRIAAQGRRRAAVFVVFLKVSDEENAVRGSSLWQEAVAIPGVRAIVDSGGREAGLFGPLSSGHTLLYNPQGKLVFEGGITASRGHEGDNLGRASIVANLLNERADSERTAVYGCALVSEVPSAKGEEACCN